jgi:hypothetical protein
MLIPTALMVLAAFNGPYVKNPNYNTVPDATKDAPAVHTGKGPAPKPPPTPPAGIFFPDQQLKEKGIVTIPRET